MVNNFRQLFCAQLSLAIVLMLAGCATSGTMPGKAGVAESVQPLIDLTGARPGEPIGGNTQQGSYIRLRTPVSISARNNSIYLVDNGFKRIFRYDHAQQTLAQFTNQTFATAASVYVAPDMTIYVADPMAGQVLHFNWDATQLPSFSAPGHLARPVSVVVDGGGGRVLVADALYDQIVVFNNLGMPLSIIKSPEVRAISAITSGPDGIYVTDRLARRVAVLGWNGEFRYAFGSGDLSEPGAIAVSRDNVVFVGDNFDNIIKVYRDGLLLFKIGGAGVTPGNFSNIGGLAVDGRMLYVTDSQNARVQIMQINIRP